MTLIGLLVLVVIVCLFVWLLQQWNPPAPIRNVVYVVLLLVVLIWLLNGFGVLGSPVLGRRL